jgi:hypothetical protein
MKIQQQSIFFAKARSSHPKDQVPICRTADVHLVGSCDYFLQPSNKARTFELFNSSDHERLLLFEVLKDDNEAKLKLPATRKLTFAPSLGLEFNSLISQRPRLSKKGFWFLDFHNRFTLPSVMNAIFVAVSERRNGPELITVRYIENGTLELDLIIDLPEILTFGIGLSCYLASYQM